MTVHLVPVPQHTDPLTIVDRIDRNHGWTPIVVVPTKADARTLNASLVNALTDNVNPLPVGHHMLRSLAHAWMAAWPITDVVVFGAAAATPVQRGMLHMWAGEHDVDLHVIAEHSDLRTVAPYLRQSHTTTWREWLDRLPNPQPVLEPHQQVAEPTVVVPTDDWPTFLTTARRVLSPADYTSVWHTYVAAFREAADTAREGHAVRQTLDRLLLTAPDLETANTRLRGAQAGFFSNDVIVIAKREQLLAVIRRTVPAIYTNHHWTSLRRLPNPAFSTAAALYMNGRGVATIARVTLADVSDALTRNTLHGEPLDPRTRHHLTALHAYRRANEMAPDEPAIGATDVAVHRLLGTARGRYGIALAPGPFTIPETKDRTIPATSGLTIRIIEPGSRR